MMILLIIHIIANIIGLLGLLAGSVKVAIQSHRYAPENAQDRHIVSESQSRERNFSKIMPIFSSFLDWGLTLYIIGVILGAFWAYESYGTFWVWDSKEIMSLITIIIYSIALFQEKKGNLVKTKIFAILGAFSAIFTLIIPTLIISYHDFLF